jgi:serine/threonine-protein kinase
MPFFCIHCRSEIDSKFKACPYCGEPITDFLRRHLEQPIDGKYKILARLGVGGMGEVYKVLHIHLNAIRVIKLMRASIANEPGADDRFIREARLATRIQHPNVAALYDFSTLEDGSRYMVWEYIEGTNLHELIESRGPLSPRYAARLAIEALHGLDAIHRAGIVHRDISPENIMIARAEGGDERVKLIDLGIAKQGDATDTAHTQTGMFVGKWKYCSPEHLGMLDAGERIDGRADLYSFGIVMYEMLTGVPPFQADTPHGYLMLHASETPRALHAVNPSNTASPALEALIFKALEKDRKKRFASAREFAQALEAIVASLDDTAGAPPPLPVSAEVTAEPTKVATPTIATAAVEAAAANATTIVTKASSPQPAAARELRKVVSTESVAAPARRPRTAIAIALSVAVIGGAAVTMLRKVPQAAPAKPITSSVLPIASQTPGRVAVNAFPWGEVTSIRNVDSGAAVNVQSPVVTPAPVELAPGTYEITLSNPAFAKPVVRRVEVKSGEEQMLDVQFADASSATLPRLDGVSQ